MQRDNLSPAELRAIQRAERRASLVRTVIAWLIVAAVMGGWALVEIFDGGIAPEPQWMTTQPVKTKGTP